MFRRVRTGRPNLRHRLDYTLQGAPSSEAGAFVLWLGRAFGFVESPATLGTADKMVPWLFREWKRTPRIDPGKVLAVRDWWTVERVDLGRLSFAEADRTQKAWHRALAAQQKRAEIAVQLRGAVVLSFPDGSAWHVISMETSDPKILKMLRAVGASLGHCYAQLNVLREYLEENNFYTLYDRRGEPHVTVAATPGGKVTDSKITGNVDIPADSRWAPHTIALIEHLPLKWSESLLSLAPVELLERLAQDSEAYVRQGVAGNTSTPPSILTHLAQAPEWYVRQGVAGNANTPPSVLIHLVQDPKWYVRQGVARNVNTPPSVLVHLVQDPDVYVRREVAWNVNTPPSVLARLAQDPNVWVRQWVVRNVNTPPSVLTRLAQDPNADVRQEVAGNIHTPPAVLTHLAQDPKWDVRQGVAANVNTSPAVLTRLARDPEAYVRQGIAANVNTPPSVLTRLAQDPDTRVRQIAMRNVNAPPVSQD